MMNFIKYFTKKPYLVKCIFISLIIIICGTAYCVSRYGVSGSKAGEYGSLCADNGIGSGDDIVNGGQSDVEADAAVQENGICFGEEQSCENGTECYVYICGCVNNPDVYKCQEGARLYEVIELAGGFSEEADREYLNLVDVVEDGQRIYVPSKEEVLRAQAEGGIESISGSGASGVGNGSYGTEKVNINTAGVEQLMTLPGIGESRAKDIISYRNINGRFKRIEDIMKVSGIKNASYEKIKDLIKV